MNNITLKSLLDLYKDDNEIVERFIELYPEQKKDGYLSVLKELRFINIKKSNTKIHLTTEKEDDETWIKVYGIIKREEWSIELTDWQEWLGMDIDKYSLKKFSELDIICYCLFEMTWWSFDNDKDKIIKEFHD